MKRNIVLLPGSKSAAPISAGVKIGELLYTSGQVGIDRVKGEIPPDIGDQTRLCLETLRKIVKEARGNFEDVVKVNVYLTNMDDFDAMNKVYKEYFPEAFPARTTVGNVRLANPKLKVEMELVAVVNEGCELS